MIHIIKKTIFYIFFLSSLSFFVMQVSANTIKKIDMDIFIDSSGNASVTEIWNVNLSQGTEGYRTYTNLKNAYITNFKVIDDSGKAYDSLTNWNTSASFDSKAYKSGIHYVTEGIELCWGISKYGNRTYTLKYKIHNFVTQYTDTQGIYFNFLNLDQTVNEAKIKIHSTIPFSLNNTRIWAFGYEGTNVFEKGSIVLDSGGKLSTSQYMVGLIRFEKNLFNTTNISNLSFDNVYNSAFSDVTDNEKNSDDTMESMKKIGLTMFLGTFLLILFNPVTIFIITVIILEKKKGRIWLYGSGKRSGELNFDPYGKGLPNDNQIDYYREIPCNKDIERAYWICLQYNVVTPNTLKQGIIGAILLKWIKKGYISVIKTKDRIFNFKDNNYAVDFTKMTHADSEIENSLFEMLVLAAGQNKILETKEFSKWSKKNYVKMMSWFDSIDNIVQSYLVQEGSITNTIEETEASFGRKKTINVRNVNPKLKEEAINMKGLKKFLLDFSLMPEREYLEVHVWEEYLIFAQLLGIADKVEEQFSKLYPSFYQETLLDTEITTVAIRNMATVCFEGVQTGFERSNYSGSSRNSGGGGSSYSSGGSSSGGSSGGGFR